jgi:hypothetical protein
MRKEAVVSLRLPDDMLPGSAAAALERYRALGLDKRRETDADGKPVKGDAATRQDDALLRKLTR